MMVRLFLLTISPAMNGIDDVLAHLKTTKSCYYHCDLHAPWGTDLPEGDWASFHFVAEGRAFWILGSEVVELDAGDFVFMPVTPAHALADRAGTARVPFASIPTDPVAPNAARVQSSGPGERSVIVCGGGRVSGLSAHPLVGALPKLVVIRSGGRAQSDLLHHTLESMAHEARRPGPGFAVVMARLVDLVMLQSIRFWLSSVSPPDNGWLAAMSDPQVGRSLVVMHRDPGRDWDVEALAREAGMARSVFAERFSNLVGQTPKLYLTKWRMHLASCWLQEDELNVAQIAQRLGYGSEAAFSRAFKRHYGQSPGGYRRKLPFARSPEERLDHGAPATGPRSLGAVPRRGVALTQLEPNRLLAGESIPGPDGDRR